MSLFLFFWALIQDPNVAFEDAYGKPKTCISTIFGQKNDKWAGGNALYLGRPIDPEKDVGIAHRTLPMGSKVVLLNPKNNKWVVATVMDAGPYGAMLRKGEKPAPGQICKKKKTGTWCVKKNKSQPGKWRGCVDTTPLAAKMLGHNGYQNIRYWPIPNTKPKSKKDWPRYKRKRKNGKRKRSRASRRNLGRSRLQDNCTQKCGLG